MKVLVSTLVGLALLAAIGWALVQRPRAHPAHPRVHATYTVVAVSAAASEGTPEAAWLDALFSSELPSSQR